MFLVRSVVATRSHLALSCFAASVMKLLRRMLPRLLLLNLLLLLLLHWLLLLLHWLPLLLLLLLLISRLQSPSLMMTMMSLGEFVRFHEWFVAASWKLSTAGITLDSRAPLLCTKLQGALLKTFMSRSAIEQWDMSV